MSFVIAYKMETSNQYLQKITSVSRLSKEIKKWETMSLCYDLRSNFNNQHTWSNFLPLLAKWLDHSSHLCIGTLLGSAFVSNERCKKNTEYKEVNLYCF